MSSKTRGELNPKTKNNDTQSQKPQNSRGRQERLASKSRGPSGKTSDATAGRDKPASETQLQPPPRERQSSEPSPAAHGGAKTTAGPVSVKPVKKSGAKPRDGGRSQQPQNSTGRQKGSAKAGRDKPASKTQRQPEQQEWHGPKTHGGRKTTVGGGKPVEKSEGAKPSSAGAEAASAAMSPPTSLKETEVVPEEKPLYTTKSRLGSGAYGVVWKVELVRPKVPFAIKQVEIFKSISDTTLTKEECVKLYKEVANQKKCADKSPFVLPIFAWSVELIDKSLRLLMAMPICAGPLDSFIKKDGICEKYKPYIKLFTLHLAEAVATLHELHVVHKDVHRGNVFIYEDANGTRLVLGDFGVSIDFSVSVKDQVDEWTETEPKLQVRDHYGIASCYLVMKYGLDGRLTPYEETTDKKLLKYSVKLKFDDLPKGSERTRKVNECGFVYSMVDPTDKPLVPAKQIKNFPFFQGGNKTHPDWALDFRTLKDEDGKRPAFATESVLSRRPLTKLLQDPNGGKLRLRKLDDKNADLAAQRTTYKVDGQDAYKVDGQDAYKVDGQDVGVTEPCLFPNNIACRCPPLGRASGCPTNTLYSKAVFEKHAHNNDTQVNKDRTQKLVEVGSPEAKDVREAVEKSKRTSTPNLIYAEKIVLCRCGEKHWADVGVRNVHDRHSFVRVCYPNGKPEWQEAGSADDARHLAEIVDATHERYREPWCMLINFFKDTEGNAIGKDAKEKLGKKKIVCTPINADALHSEINRVVEKQPKPSSSKR